MRRRARSERIRRRRRADPANRLSAKGRGRKLVAPRQSEEVLRLFNQQYWDIDSLDLAGGSVMASSSAATTASCTIFIFPTLRSTMSSAER